MLKSKILKRGQIWRGLDGQVRVLKGVVAYTAMYDVRTKTFLPGIGDIEMIETSTIDTDFFRRFNCSEELPVGEVERFYLEEVFDED